MDKFQVIKDDSTEVLKAFFGESDELPMLDDDDIEILASALAEKLQHRF